MASRFNFTSVFFAGLLLGGCSTDMAPQGDDQTTGGASASKDAGGAKGDAGSKADAGAKADAGKKDAGSSSDEDEAIEDEAVEDEADEPTDEPTDDEAAPAGDAGTKVDAGGTKADAGSSADAGGGGAGGDCSELTYEAFGKAFLDTYCISCHGMMKPTFKTLAEVTTNKAAMKTEVTAKVMPPKGAKAPTDAERAEFAKFIDCGPK